MNKKLFVSVLFIGIVLSNALFSISNVLAASVSVGLSPMYEKIILMPGEKYRGSVSVVNSNSATEDLHYKAEIKSYSPISTNNDGVYDNADTETVTSFNNIMKWITIENPEGVVAPNSKTKLNYTINVPADAVGGGQYASIAVTDANDETGATDGNSVGIKNIMSVLYIIYADVAGETRKEGIITENNFPSILTDGQLTATSMIRNNGNVHADASYTLQVWPLFSDEEICTNEEEPETSLIMPETERYHVQSCNLPAVGIFKAKQVVKIFGEVSELEKIVIVCPLWLIFIVLFVIVAFVIWVVIVMKKHKKTAANEE